MGRRLAHGHHGGRSWLVTRHRVDARCEERRCMSSSRTATPFNLCVCVALPASLPAAFLPPFHFKTECRVHAYVCVHAGALPVLLITFVCGLQSYSSCKRRLYTVK